MKSLLMSKKQKSLNPKPHRHSANLGRKSKAQDSVLRTKAEARICVVVLSKSDKARKYALNKFAEGLLPVIDNPERVVQAADAENEAAVSILKVLS
ncbi:nucleotide exchange factor GrpE [Vibrio lentus]|nr:nucleotide exchange factor GrpE [Vibrio lentus]